MKKNYSQGRVVRRVRLSAIVGTVVGALLLTAVFATSQWTFVQTGRPASTNTQALDEKAESRIMLETWQAKLTPNMKRVAFCESSLRPDAIGDGGKAIGLMQIHMDYWEVSEEEALNPYFSIAWAKDKNPRYWTCARILGVKSW